MNSCVLSGSDPSSETVTLSDLQQPHDDELTLFRLHLESDGLSASCFIESLGGDSGFIVNDHSGEQGPSISLSQLMKDLGTGPLWKGTREWRTLASELRVRFFTDDLGHVAVEFGIKPIPWRSKWAASTTLQYNLGDLVNAGEQIDNWVRSSLRLGR